MPDDSGKQERDTLTRSMLTCGSVTFRGVGQGGKPRPQVLANAGYISALASSTNVGQTRLNKCSKLINPIDSFTRPS